MQNIRIRGARTHNLKNIDLDLPRDRLIVFTGLSGSGKSSLAFDTIYAEGQRRYVESLSTYARQFLSMMEKPDIDTIEGLSPAISIEQKSTSHNPRSTVGTVTEIYDYLRLLYARAGTPRCPDHHIDLAAQTVSQMVDAVLQHSEGTPLMLLAPAIAERKGEHAELMEELQAGGFVRARIDGKVVELDQAPKLDVRRKHTVEAIVDRFKVRPDLAQRLAESFETALRLGQGVARVAYMDAPERPELVFSDKFACPICNYSLSELEPRLFSFNSPIGACPACDGLGTQDFFDPEKIVANPHLSLAGCGSRLGSAQCLLLPADSIPGAAYQVRHRSPLREPAAKNQGSGAVRQRGRANRIQVPRRQGGHGLPQTYLRGHRQKSRAPLQRDRIGDGARRVGEVPFLAGLPRLSGNAAEPRRPKRVRRRHERAGSVGAVGGARPAVLRRPGSCWAGAGRSQSRSSRKSRIGWDFSAM